MLWRQRDSYQGRIRAHLYAMACWDSVLMVCTAGAYTVSTIIYGHVRHDGPYAYVLYACTMCANFCHTGTLWQTVAITVERLFIYFFKIIFLFVFLFIYRYMAVSRPHMVRIFETRVPVWLLTVCIIFTSALITLTTFVSEYTIETCLIWTPLIFDKDEALMSVHTYASPVVARDFLCKSTHEFSYSHTLVGDTFKSADNHAGVCEHSRVSRMYVYICVPNCSNIFIFNIFSVLQLLPDILLHCTMPFLLVDKAAWYPINVSTNRSSLSTTLMYKYQPAARSPHSHGAHCI
jgi:hypothetical protein